MPKNIAKTLFLLLSIVFSACSDDPKNTKQEISDDQWPTYEEGIHFKKLDLQSDRLKSDITVFFWYQCPHCNTLRDPLDKWEKENRDVSVEKVHSLISERWVNDHMLYQALLYNGVFEESFDALFDYIHSPKKERSSQTIPQILKSKGVGIEEEDLMFTDLEKSKMVTQARKISEVEREIGAMGVPYIVVKGKYLVKNSGFNSYRDMFKFIDWVLHHGNGEEK